MGNTALLYPKIGRYYSSHVYFNITIIFFMILLDVISFDPDLVYEVLATLVILITGLGFFFNLRSKTQLLENDVVNLKETVVKLETKVDATYSKIEDKIAEIEIKINNLPTEIINLIKQLK